MTIRISAIMMIVVCGIIVAAERNASTVKRYQIDVTVVDESLNPKIKQHHSALTSDGTFHLHDGGEFKADHDGAGLQWGITIVGTIKEKENGVQRIELTIEHSEKVANDEARTQVVVADVLKIRTDMIVGESQRIRCGGERYCELRLD